LYFISNSNCISGQITAAVNSILYYPTSNSFEEDRHIDFLPSFMTPNVSSQVQKEAAQLCTVNGVLNEQCSQDYIVSGGNTILALGTLTADENYKSILQHLSKHNIRQTICHKKRKVGLHLVKYNIQHTVRHKKERRATFN